MGFSSMYNEQKKYHREVYDEAIRSGKTDAEAKKIADEAERKQSVEILGMVQKLTSWTFRLLNGLGK